MTASNEEQQQAPRPTSRAAQRMLTMRLYPIAKLKGRRPKSWLFRFRKLVEAGLIAGYDYMKTSSRSSTSLGNTLLSALASAAAEHASDSRCRTLDSLDKSDAAQKGRTALDARRREELNAKIDAFRTSHSNASNLVAFKVARWWVQTHESELHGEERKKAIRRLTRQLRRRKLAS